MSFLLALAHLCDIGFLIVPTSEHGYAVNSFDFVILVCQFEDLSDILSIRKSEQIDKMRIGNDRYWSKNFVFDSRYGYVIRKSEHYPGTQGRFETLEGCNKSERLHADIC